MAWAWGGVEDRFQGTLEDDIIAFNNNVPSREMTSGTEIPAPSKSGRTPADSIINPSTSHQRPVPRCAHFTFTRLLPAEPCLQPLRSRPDPTASCLAPGRREGAGGTAPESPEYSHKRGKETRTDQFLFLQSAFFVSGWVLLTELHGFFSDVGLGFLFLRERKNKEAIRLLLAETGGPGLVGVLLPWRPGHPGSSLASVSPSVRWLTTPVFPTLAALLLNTGPSWNIPAQSFPRWAHLVNTRLPVPEM